MSQAQAIICAKSDKCDVYPRLPQAESLVRTSTHLQKEKQSNA